MTPLRYLGILTGSILSIISLYLYLQPTNLDMLVIISSEIGAVAGMGVILLSLYEGDIS